MPTSNRLSTDQLRQALQLSEQIESLQQRLNAVLSGTGSTAAAPSPKSAGNAKPAGSAKKKKGGGMTPGQKARISATLKARWAAKKKAASA
jgi:hypothetical protein